MKNFKEYLLNKLLNEIVTDLKEKYNEDLNCEKERYDRIIESITKDYFKNNEILFIKHKEKIKKKNTKTICQARIWNNGCGDHQCTRNIFDNKNHLCREHNNLFITNNLWLGLITEKRPENPIRNGKVKKWRD